MTSIVKDVMTIRVIWVKKSASFQEMATALREHRISAFPVVDDDGKLIGVVSEADLLTKEALGIDPDGMPGMITGLLHHKEHAKARGITAGDVMTSPAVTVAPEDTVEHAARLMFTRKVKRLPVVDAGTHVVGIISRTDVLAVFDRSDEEIGKEIAENIIRDGLLTDPATFDVIVKDGAVTLAGKPETSEVGHELVHRARHVHGVVAVRDRLSYPLPEHIGSSYDPLINFPVD